VSPLVRERLARLALVVGSCGLVLAGAEVLARVSDTGAHAARMARKANRARTLALDLYSENLHGQLDVDLRERAVRERYAREGLGDLETAAGSTPFGVECRYNTRGFREGQIGPKRPGTPRIMVLGDSFTEGAGVQQDAVFTSVMRERLSAWGGGSVEVLNCGHRGWDFPKLHEVFLELLADEPDVLIYAMNVNDVAQGAEFRGRQRRLDDWVVDRRWSAPGVAGRFWQHSRLLTWLADRVEDYRMRRATLSWYRDMYAEPNAQGWRQTQHMIRDMQQRMHARGGVLIVALWPLLVGDERDYPLVGVTETVARFCSQAGIEFVDLRGALAGVPLESLWVSPVDHHPDAAAHRRVGEGLAALLRDRPSGR
jgi:hypothetical protein